MHTMWRFTIGRFTVKAEIEESQDLDLSWDDTGEVREKLDSGEFVAFDTKVSVWLNGCEIGTDWLCQSIYADASDFFADHRDPDPMNRNCSLMRAALGDRVCIGHYFPNMVREAISEARAWLADATPSPVTRAA